MAERWGLVSRNVAKLVDPPRVPRHEIEPLTPEQARQLIDAAGEDRLRAVADGALHGTPSGRAHDAPRPGHAGHDTPSSSRVRCPPPLSRRYHTPTPWTCPDIRDLAAGRYSSFWH